MSVSPDVVIMTCADLEGVKTASFFHGVRRGRLEERSEQNNPPSGAAEKQDPASPDAGGGPKFQPEGWTFEDHGNGIVYVRAPSGKHAAIGYFPPAHMDLSAILHQLVGAIITANSQPSQ